MNTKTLIAATFVALLAANAASAQEAIPATWANEVTPQVVASSVSRAQVKAELALARANGELDTASDNYGSLASVAFVSTKSRAEVKSETVHAMATLGGLSQGDRTGG